MVAKIQSRDVAIRHSIEVLGEIVSLYDRLGLMIPALHAATALDAARSALDECQRVSFPADDIVRRS